MALILIIEDDPTTRMLHTSALSGVPGLAVVSASSLAEARLMLTHSSPDLVLLDLRLPDGTGLDLLDTLSALEVKPAVIVVSSFLDDLEQVTVQSTRLAVVAKPIEPACLRERVMGALSLERQSSPFSLPEYLQMACLGRHSLRLRVLVAGQSIGSVAVYKGDVWEADCGPLKGFEAFFSLVSAAKGVVQVLVWPGEGEEPRARQLQGGYQELLLEAACHQDEQQSGAGDSLAGSESVDFSELAEHVAQGIEAELRWSSLRPPATVALSTRAEDPAAGLGFEALVAEGVRSVVNRDYSRAVALLERAQLLQPTNAGIRHRLERLYELGYQATPSEKE